MPPDIFIIVQGENVLNLAVYTMQPKTCLQSFITEKLPSLRAHDLV
uniref:Uncharacterized protein n=1 Tax=Rhizophora mucronata TaxID=61149 RepID=A0A2P2P0N2_RHIMU